MLLVKTYLVRISLQTTDVDDIGEKVTTNDVDENVGSLLNEMENTNLDLKTSTQHEFVRAYHYVIDQHFSQGVDRNS